MSKRRRTPRPCAERGCPELTTATATYCEAHTPAPRPGRAMPRDWKATRARILKRDHHVCRLQLEGCKGKATSVDHLVSPLRGGSEDDTNLVACCWPCQQRKGDRPLPAGHPLTRP